MHNQIDKFQKFPFSSSQFKSRIFLVFRTANIEHQKRSDFYGAIRLKTFDYDSAVINWTTFDILNPNS